MLFFSVTTLEYFPTACYLVLTFPNLTVLSMQSDIRILFHGHSAFQIECENWNILIDPFITGNPVATVDAESLEPTHIILTHGHGDHLGDTIEIAKRTGAMVITTFEVANYLKDRGLENIADLGIGGGRNFDFGRVKCTIAHHGSAAPDGTYMGAAAGALIFIGGRTLYHSGDTALTMDMKLLGEMYSIDVAMLPIGDNYTMDVTDAVKAVEFVDPKIAIPMHYDTFPVVQADPEKFREGVEAQGKQAVILKPGEDFVLRAA